MARLRRLTQVAAHATATVSFSQSHSDGAETDSVHADRLCIYLIYTGGLEEGPFACFTGNAGNIHTRYDLFHPISGRCRRRRKKKRFAVPSLWAARLQCTICSYGVVQFVARRGSYSTRIHTYRTEARVNLAQRNTTSRAT